MVPAIGLIIGVYVLMRCIEIFCFHPDRYRTEGTDSFIKIVALGTLVATVALMFSLI